ncbi:MAG: 2-amino-4-hydroxy-6-hydroxymethyldihydropteridine diphosphokinase [Thermoanaerobaculum sp.]|nr:2-amino-4-hydroxy-6-hydroxymethyldihydropteridine diphosphokinase [Thermoanaerobaculum sp.]
MQLILGLGGNVGNVPATFAWLLGKLAAHAAVLATSSLYRSAPLGPPQPAFFNAALLLSFAGHPQQLFELCQAWEREAGRQREVEPRWGPRPLDLDLLMAPQVVMVSKTLVLPHPRLAQRRFALLPAAEVAPHWVHPRQRRTLAELARMLAPQGQECELVGAFPCPASLTGAADAPAHPPPPPPGGTPATG